MSTQFLVKDLLNTCLWYYFIFWIICMEENKKRKLKSKLLHDKRCHRRKCGRNEIEININATHLILLLPPRNNSVSWNPCNTHLRHHHSRERKLLRRIQSVYFLERESCAPSRFLRIDFNASYATYNVVLKPIFSNAFFW